MVKNPSLKNRLQAVQKYISEAKIGILIVEDLIDLGYLTNLHLSAGKLLLTEQEGALFVDGRYREMCEKNSPFPVHTLDNTSLTNWLTKHQQQQTVGFDTESTTYKSYMDWQQLLPNGLKLQPLSRPISGMRMIKDADEIDLLRQAGKLGSEGFDFVCRILKEGITEREVAIELEIFWRRHGGDALAFDSIIAFGPNSSMPHYRPRDTALKKGMTVLIDIGVKKGLYHSDMTRTLFYGEPPSKMVEIYEVVRVAQQRAVDLCRPGTLIQELDKTARDYITAAGYGDNFSHNLGHGVGLEIHEPPTLKQNGPHSTVPLAEGMVITIEPGIYLSGIGGVRIEDTLVITHNGYEDLTNRPKGVLVLT